MDQLVDLTVGILQELVADVQALAWMIVGQFGWEVGTRMALRELHHLLDLGRNHGRHRSLIRLIGSVMKMTPPRQQWNLASNSSCDTFVPSFSSTVCTESIGIVEEFIWEYEEETEQDEEEAEQEEAVEDCSEFMSTVSDWGQENRDSKLDAVREDLAKLREQIAILIQSKEIVPSMPSPPPPPPPPPPPLFPPPFEHVQPQVELVRRDLFKSGNSELPPRPPPALPVAGSRGRNVELPSMTEVLKGLGSVKLRPVARSPGGTPLRQAPLSNAQDPCALIAAALKRRFACIQPVDEEDEYAASNCSEGKENDSFGSSPEKSPLEGRKFSVKRKSLAKKVGEGKT